MVACLPKMNSNLLNCMLLQGYANIQPQINPQERRILFTTTSINMCNLETVTGNVGSFWGETVIGQTMSLVLQIFINLF